jgi:hypothetical protein
VIQNNSGDVLVDRSLDLKDGRLPSGFSLANHGNQDRATGQKAHGTSFVARLGYSFASFRNDIVTDFARTDPRNCAAPKLRLFSRRRAAVANRANGSYPATQPSVGDVIQPKVTFINAQIPLVEDFLNLSILLLGLR